MLFISHNFEKMLPTDESTISYQISKTAAKIALQNFEWRFITLVLFNSTLWCGVDIFLRTYKKVAVVGQRPFYSKFGRRPRQYVLFGTSLTDIAQSLKWLQENDFDNTRKLIIICQSLNDSECDETLAIKELWHHKVTNVIFLKEVRNTVTGFTYYPYSDSNCDSHDPVLVDLTGLNSRKPCNLFPMKMKNLNKCPLIASTFHQPPFMTVFKGIPVGADGNLLRLIAQQLNASLTVMMPRIESGWGWTDSNGKWTGSLADVYYGAANLSITSAAITLERYLNFHLTYEYGTMSVIWITCTSKKVHSTLKLAYPFQNDSRIVILLSFICVVVVAVIMESKFWLRISRKLKMKSHRRAIVFYSWMICMGLPTTKLPKKAVFLYILMLWMWYCVLIRTFYQASLIPAMKSNYYYQEIYTLEDAIDQEVPIGGGSPIKDFYVNYPTVYNQWIDVKARYIIPTLKDIAKGKKLLLAMNKEVAQTIIWENKMQVHVLSQKVITSPTVIFFKKFSPLVDPVNRLLVRLVESGFRYKFYKDYTRSLKVPHSHSSESIHLEHYAGCYAILIGGWVISFVVFVIEIFFHRLKK